MKHTDIRIFYYLTAEIIKKFTVVLFQIRRSQRDPKALAWKDGLVCMERFPWEEKCFWETYRDKPFERFQNWMQVLLTLNVN